MEKIKRIGKNGDKIGMTTFTGEGAAVKVKEPDNAVAVRDYVASKGYSGIVDWDGDTPTVAGEKIKPLFINDGIAYVDKNEADNAIAKMEKSVGIIGADGAEKARAEKYGQMEDKAENRSATIPTLTLSIRRTRKNTSVRRRMRCAVS